jgi:hypothetical protein
MIILVDKASGGRIGEISGKQLRFLMDQMEEESLDDVHYSITELELDIFEREGADPGLIRLLRAALGGRDELVIEWREEQA